MSACSVVPGAAGAPRGRGGRPVRRQDRAARAPRPRRRPPLVGRTIRATATPPERPGNWAARSDRSDSGVPDSSPGPARTRPGRKSGEGLRAPRSPRYPVPRAEPDDSGGPRGMPRRPRRSETCAWPRRREEHAVRGRRSRRCALVIRSAPPLRPPPGACASAWSGARESVDSSVKDGSSGERMHSRARRVGAAVVALASVGAAAGCSSGAVRSSRPCPARRSWCRYPILR